MPELQKRINMKKFILTAFLSVFTLIAFAAGEAVIKFEKTSHDFGTFPETEKVTCTFKFTNTGDTLLVIHQAIASCGCTVPQYSKEPIKPGETGEIVVTYNGAGKFPGHFKKSITIRTNAKQEIVRLYVEGDMVGK